MSLVVNSNISSLNAQRQLSSSGAELDKASERLASGRRINSAADDAAGLAISNRQTSQIRGLDQAIRNANDGISMIQTAEGALDETTNILQRMRELAVQSSNGIYSDADRSTLDAEVQQLKAEITRIAESTSFNGANILDGSLGKVDLQVGAMANQTISFEIGKLDAKGLGGAASGDIVGSAVDLSAGFAGLTGDVTINGQAVSFESLNDTTTLEGALQVLNESVSGVEFSASTRFEAQDAGTGVLRGGDTLTIGITNADGTTSSLQIGGTGNMDELVAKINAAGGNDISASLGDDGKLVVESASGAQLAMTSTSNAAVGLSGDAAIDTGNAQLSMTSTDGSDITVAYTEAADAELVGINERSGSGDVTGFAAVADGTVTLLEGQLKINGVDIGTAAGTDVADIVNAINAKSNETGVFAAGGDGQTLVLNSIGGDQISIELGKTAGAADTLAGLGLMETNTSKTSGESVEQVTVATAAGAQKAIGTIDRALEQINGARAELGAVNNRLDFTVANLSNVMENTSAARSRIVDADFAAETAALSRSQVLQQASQAMLAQANARPQQVLSLLQ